MGEETRDAGQVGMGDASGAGEGLRMRNRSLGEVELGESLGVMVDLGVTSGGPAGDGAGREMEGVPPWPKRPRPHFDVRLFSAGHYVRTHTRPLVYLAEPTRCCTAEVSAAPAGPLSRPLLRPGTFVTRMSRATSNFLARFV